ncbi:LysR family transcriptional regulator [Novacetimonas maltaceti]|uniref:HTH-type transcriptional regulator CysL n=1 Tax=Novacetimonas maltaceti TaxID=1203393 RepID=A0A2S3W2I8_9PROT|nr:LysR substrate-binding domain-containing protein [Novacetimonas maltaceti]POF63079.1 HTH-type transcriptional regulator CysL [Novacetimonas maltaceti]PYD59968.1 LysR family transcriptional regulator [Novacetimonas maltaceti]
MTLEQLRIFAVVARTLNMRVAAQALNLTQPAISAAISALEHRYSTRLFHRIGRRLELNEAGHAFLPAAQAVLAAAGDAVRTLDDLSGLLRGRLRIAASQTVATYWLPAFLARFALRHPAIELDLHAGNTAQAAAAVIAGHADMGFVEGRADGDIVLHQPVGGDRLCLYTAPTHPLTARKITRQDILGAQWAVREEGSGTRDHLASCLHSLFRVELRDLNIRLVLPSNDAVMESVLEGELVTAVSSLAAGPRVRAGLLVALECDLEKRSFHMLRHRERPMGRAAAAFMEMIQAAPP